MKRLTTALLVAVTALAALVAIPTAAPPSGAQAQPAALTTSPGVLRGWGSNGNKQIGTTNTTLCTSSNPILCSTPYTSVSLFGVTQVAAGAFHTLFLRADGTVWGVGSNQQAQLGNDPSGGGDVS